LLADNYFYINAEEMYNDYLFSCDICGKMYTVAEWH